MKANRDYKEVNRGCGANALICYIFQDSLWESEKLKAEIVSLPEQVNTILHGAWAKKEKGELADLRVSICLGPMSITKQLHFELKSSRKTIQLVEYSFPSVFLEYRFI